MNFNQNRTVKMRNETEENSKTDEEITKKWTNLKDENPSRDKTSPLYSFKSTPFSDVQRNSPFYNQMYTTSNYRHPNKSPITELLNYTSPTNIGRSYISQPSPSRMKSYSSPLRHDGRSFHHEEMFSRHDVLINQVFIQLEFIN